MKNLFFVSLMAMMVAVPNAFAASSSTPWWKQPTICRISTTNCYVGMGAGFDAGMWDSGANCYGMKIICPRAAGKTDPTLMGKNAIKNISPDFDANVLIDGCFGARKTSAGGTLASIKDGKDTTHVWCRGILDNPSETVATGEITLGAEPTCAQLAERGYTAVVDNKCYGKHYNPREYYIECGTALTPNRIIVLNGADYTANMSASNPTDQARADEKFKTMYTVSQAQYAKYFSNKD